MSVGSRLPSRGLRPLMAGGTRGQTCVMKWDIAAALSKAQHGAQAGEKPPALGVVGPQPDGWDGVGGPGPSWRGAVL